MSTLISFDPYGDYERAYNVEMLQTQVFGAVFSAWEYRRDSVAITNVEIARRVGCTRSQISKTMSGPQNWTLKTIAEMATALDLEFRFTFVDKTNNVRRFDANGVAYDFSLWGSRQTKPKRGVARGGPQMTTNNTMNNLAINDIFSEDIGLLGQPQQPAVSLIEMTLAP